MIPFYNAREPMRKTGAANELIMLSSFTELLEGSLTAKANAVTIQNPSLVQEKIIDNLIFQAVFSKDEELKKESRMLIRQIAQSAGIYPASINSIYRAIGQGKIEHTFTVPACNIRTLTYDTAQIVFDLAKTLQLGPVVFEIARSEIEYTDQKPDEYTVVVLAAAIKTGYKGPVFLQGDHYQLSKRRFKEDPKLEINVIKKLIDESLKAQFYNIDIDASTLVNLEEKTIDLQQTDNYEVTAELTYHIRKHQPKDTIISIGAEIGHIGGKNSTPQDLQAFMDGYLSLIDEKEQNGIGKISVQTGTSHGGIPLPNGKMADVKLDFNVIRKVGAVARKYTLGGVVQHGASTLPPELFGEFPKNNTLEIHLATGFQNIVYDHMPDALRKTMYQWISDNLQKEREPDWSDEQFIYKCRKKALGPFKENLWTLSQKEKQPILNELRKQFVFLFEKLQITQKRKIIDKYA